MNTSPDAPGVLVVGAGGIGAPAAWALAEAGVARLLVLDVDAVELSNLHRQILFDDDALGEPKVEALARALRRVSKGLEVTTIAGRALPETAGELVGRASVVLDATDNFASRFLLADAAHLAGVPIVHAAAVRWQGTCFVGGGPRGRPCYRCLFEDLPEGPAPDCAGAGVVGPVCGVIGGVAADAVLSLLGADDRLLGSIASFDGKAARFRRVPVRPRPSCPLCGEAPAIRDLDRARYLGPRCEAPAAAPPRSTWRGPAFW